MINKIIRLFRNNEIVKDSLLLSLFTCLIKIAGYFEKVLLAYFWGTSYEADTYNAVFTIIISIFIFFREIIEPGFLNTFLETGYKFEKNEAWKVFYSTFWCMMPLAVLIACVLFFYPAFVTHLILPGFSNERFALSSEMIKNVSFACIFLVLSTLTNITLNAYKQFTQAAAGDFTFKLSIILCILFFANTVGISAAIYGIITGAIMKLFIHIAALRKNTKNEFFSFRSNYLQQIGQLSWPLFIGILFSQISTLTDNIFASYLPDGSISALSYAKKIVELPIVIFPYVLSTVLFPYFSQLNIENNLGAIRSSLYKSLRWIAIAFIPIALFTFFFSDFIIQIIFQHGAFNAVSTRLTAEPLAIYSLGMPAFAVETILVIAYFALSDTKTPVFIGILCTITNILITWFSVRYFAYLGIAWGLVVSKTLKVIILLYLLKNKLKKQSTGYE